MDAIFVSFKAAKIDLDFVSDRKAKDVTAPRENLDLELLKMDDDDDDEDGLRPF